MIANYFHIGRKRVELDTIFCKEKIMYTFFFIMIQFKILFLLHIRVNIHSCLIVFELNLI